MELRIRVHDDGTLRLPAKLVRKLDLKAGSYVKVTVEEGVLSLEETDFDPFEEAKKPTDPGSIEKFLQDEEQKKKDAAKTFEKLMENPPEVRPEDRPDFWD